MTRQKKEILKKIEEIDKWIGADMELGRGFAPADAYRELEEMSYQLFEQLAKLRHFTSVEEMEYDPRGSEFPF